MECHNIPSPRLTRYILNNTTLAVCLVKPVCKLYDSASNERRHLAAGLRTNRSRSVRPRRARSRRDSDIGSCRPCCHTAVGSREAGGEGSIRLHLGERGEHSSTSGREGRAFIYIWQREGRAFIYIWQREGRAFVYIWERGESIGLHLGERGEHSSTSGRERRALVYIWEREESIGLHLGGRGEHSSTSGREGRALVYIWDRDREQGDVRFIYIRESTAHPTYRVQLVILITTPYYKTQSTK